MTHASRDTTTGLAFEKEVKLSQKGTDLTKHNLYHFMKTKGIDWKTIISKKLLPDEAYFDEETKTFYIFEKNFNRLLGQQMKSLRRAHLKLLSLEK